MFLKDFFYRKLKQKPRESIGTIFMTIRRLKVATSSENEEKLDFRKKPIQTELIKHFYTGHEVRFLA